MPVDNPTNAPTLDEPVPLISNVIVSPNASEDGTPIDVVSNAPVADEGPLVGTQGEETIWEGQYSPKNYAGKLLIGIVLAGIWLALEAKAWNRGDSPWEFTAILAGIAAAAYWLYQGYRLIRKNRGHRYRLTTRRIFFSSGFFNRRVDQVELAKVKDLFVQQTLIGSWLKIGTVYVISAEETLPRAAMLGIEDPHTVMDAIWHHTRVEKDRRKS
jgi:Bacterial PH domain